MDLENSQRVLKPYNGAKPINEEFTVSIGDRPSSVYLEIQAAI
jgi:hypothetical protein